MNGSNLNCEWSFPLHRLINQIVLISMKDVDNQSLKLVTFFVYYIIKQLSQI